jgi:hypothetical protein
MSVKAALLVEGSDNASVPLKVDGPGGVEANLVEIGKGGGLAFYGDRYSNWFAGGSLCAGRTAGLRWTEGSAIYNGVGAPKIAGTKGDLYLRSDTPGTANQRLYICTATGTAETAVWLAIL